MTDLPKDLPTPQPPGSPEGLFGPPDPLRESLDRLEASVQRNYQDTDAMYADPIARALDMVELATERGWNEVQSASEWRHLLAARDLPETATTPPKPSGAEQDSVAGITTSVPTVPEALDGGRGKLPRPVPDLFRAREGDRRGPLFQPGQHPEPQYRMTGHSTGIRNLDVEPDRYCRLHEDWVSGGDCAACGDFERMEATENDQAEQYCQHCHPEPDGERDDGPRVDDQGEPDE